MPDGCTILTSFTGAVGLAGSDFCESSPHPAKTIVNATTNSVTNGIRFIGPPLLEHNYIQNIITFL